jgi:hypothetical protein
MTDLFSNRELRRRAMTVCLILAVVLCIGVPFVLAPLMLAWGVLWSEPPADFQPTPDVWIVLAMMLKIVLGPLALFWPLVFGRPLA